MRWKRSNSSGHTLLIRMKQLIKLQQAVTMLNNKRIVASQLAFISAPVLLLLPVFTMFIWDVRPAIIILSTHLALSHWPCQLFINAPQPSCMCSRAIIIISVTLFRAKFFMIKSSLYLARFHYYSPSRPCSEHKPPGLTQLFYTTSTHPKNGVNIVGFVKPTNVFELLQKTKYVYHILSKFSNDVTT